METVGQQQRDVAARAIAEQRPGNIVKAEKDTKAGIKGGSEEMKNETVVAGKENKDSSSVEYVQKGVKRQINCDVRPGKKRKIHVGSPVPPNPLMQLNKLKPHLKYEVKCQKGHRCAPVFVASVQVNEQKFTGKRRSKKLAKDAAAQAALASFVQFQESPQGTNIMSKPTDSLDFTTGTVENGSAIFNRFRQHTNGTRQRQPPPTARTGESPLNARTATAIAEACEKNPVMLLSGIHPGLSFNLVIECSTAPSRRFCMAVVVNGEQFEGWGSSKRKARANAARAALSKLYSIDSGRLQCGPSPFRVDVATCAVAEQEPPLNAVKTEGEHSHEAGIKDCSGRMKDETVHAEEENVDSHPAEWSVERQLNGDGRPRKVRAEPSVPRNPMMHLSELKPGVKYEVESRGLPRAPVSVASVQVNEQKLTGKGQSKQLAKHAALPMNIMSSKHTDRADFTTDNPENKSAVSNQFRQPLAAHAASVTKPKQCEATREADKKTPLAILSEIHPGLTFNSLIKCTTLPSHRYRLCMAVVVNGEQFEGWGREKETAKANAARAVLSKLYNIDCNTFQCNPSPLRVAAATCAVAEQEPPLNAAAVKTEEEPSHEAGIKDCSGEIKDENVDSHPSEWRVKRQLNCDGSPRKKRKVMQLNQLKPGLQYEVESQDLPGAPVSVESAQVNEQKFTGKGHSKKLAKHAAALATSKHTVSVDFTTDNHEIQSAFSNQFGQPLATLTGTSVTKPKQGEASREANKKTPLAILREIHPGLTFNLLIKCITVPSHRYQFCMAVVVNGEQFEGWGREKKTAKANAARAVLCKLYGVNYNKFQCGPSPLSEDIRQFTLPLTVAEKIAKSVQDLFHEKMAGNQEQAEWKVLAGIAMTKDEEMSDIQVISIGTGTKCIGEEHISLTGAALNDCHAEIISRRCLKDFFYTQLELHRQGETDQSVFMKKEGGGFTLRPHIKFHLFISTSPCGDAKIFYPQEISNKVGQHPSMKSLGVLSTKLGSCEGTITVKPRQRIQTFKGVLQGQRLLTMSCSDKIASWNVLGLQGALLSCFVEPIYLDSIILGSLFNPKHMYQAMWGRIEKSIGHLPKLFKLNKPKMCAITTMETRHLIKPSNFSINWTVGLGRPEIVNSVTGRTESDQVSRLAKRSFFQRFANLYGHIPTLAKHQQGQHLQLYSVVKNRITDYQNTKKLICKAFEQANLGVWAQKLREQDEFDL